MIDCYSKASWSVNLPTNNLVSNLKVNTGAQTNVIHVNKYKIQNLDTNLVQPSTERLIDFNKRKRKMLALYYLQ